MPGFAFRSDRSLLPPAHIERGREPNAVVPRSLWRAIRGDAATVHRQVGGSARGARPLEGRLTQAPASRPGDALDHAALRGTQSLNHLLNRIEETRADGKLSPLATAMLGQLERIADACRLIAGGPAVGETLMQQAVELEDLLHEHEPEQDREPEQEREPGVTLSSGMDQLRKLLPGDADAEHLTQIEIDQLSAWTDEVAAQAADRIKYLAQSLHSSPLSLSSLYETKARISEAAVAVLKAAIAQRASDRSPRALHDRELLENVQSRFETRRQTMLEAAEQNRGMIGAPGQFGTKKLTGLSRLLHPMRARAECAARQGFARELANGLSSPDVTRLDTRGTNEMDVVQDALALIYQQSGVRGNAKRAVGRAFAAAIDANPAWNVPLRHEIHLPVTPAPVAPAPADGSAIGVHTRIAHSEISPAAVFFRSSTGLAPYNGTGVNAHRITEGSHAVNLAQTRLINPQGKAMFTGVRHGVNSAFGLTKEGVAEMDDEELGRAIHTTLDPKHWVYSSSGPLDGQADLELTIRAVRRQPALVEQMRAAANRQRATEIITLTVMTDPALCEAALNGDQPTVDLLSISLLTPDSLRRGLHDNESLMLRDQVRAWQSVSGLLSITIPNSDGVQVDVQVRVNPIAVNYGVNQGALQSFGGVQPDIISGWHVSDALNEQSLRALFGNDLSDLASSRAGVLGSRIKQLEEAHPQEPATAQDQPTPLEAALELMRQIGAIHREGSYRRAGNEPYKMPTRLAVLAEMLGVKIAFNCKSGKDRSGELDAQIKHFKLQMAMTGRVPHYEREPDAEEIRQFHEVLTNSGNFEMQHLNTGYGGYKLHGVTQLYRQFGAQGKNDELTLHFHGPSSLAAS